MEPQRAPSAAASGSQGPRYANKQLQQTQSQVDEVVGIMKVNVEKVSFFLNAYCNLSFMSLRNRFDIIFSFYVVFITEDQCQ